MSSTPQVSRTPKSQVRSTVTFVLIALVVGFILGWYAAGGNALNTTPLATLSSGDLGSPAPSSPSSPSSSAFHSSASSAPATSQAVPNPTNSDDYLEELYLEQRSDVQVEGSGVVSKILADDTDGDAHQRFILKLDSGQTLLVAHNIDVAPRLDGLRVGDRVSFFGEYVYTEEGGTIHWTHRPSSGSHIAGWLEWNGKKYW